MLKLAFIIFFFGVLKWTSAAEDRILNCRGTSFEFCEISGEIIGKNEIIKRIETDEHRNFYIKEVAFVGSSVHSLPAEVFTEFDQLEGLILVKQELYEIKPGSFENARYLNILDLSGNKISKLDDEVFKGASNLTSLRLNWNLLTELTEKVFSELSKLTTLSLENNRLEKIHQNSLRALPALKNLHMSNNQLTVLPNDLFSDNPNIEYINFSNNKLKSVWFETFSQLSHLKTLLLAKNECIDAVYEDHAQKEIRTIEEDLMDCSEDLQFAG